MSDTEIIVQDQATGLFGFRLEMGRDRNGIRTQARRTGFRIEKAALTEYRRLCRQRDAQHPKPRLSDTVQDLCQVWLLAREPGNQKCRTPLLESRRVGLGALGDA